MGMRVLRYHRSMMRALLVVSVVVLALGGCDDKKKKCNKLAEHLQTVAEKEGRPTSQSADYQTCMDSFGDKQIDCAMKAQSTSEYLACAK